MREGLDRRRLMAGALAAGCMPAVLAAAPAHPSRRPNFIVILCDDLGYGDVGAYGGRAIATPHLDRMAREGTLLTDYYAPASVCTPSRAGLLTGRYPIRTGLATGVLYPGAPGGLKADEVTLARALKPDYATALIGKWHLGDHAPFLPTDHGFDRYVGIPYSHDMVPLVLQSSRAGDAAARTEPVDYPNLQQRFAAEAGRFIEENKDRPFLLNLCLSSPHLPEFPQQGYAGRSAAGAYGDVVMEIDAIVGRLLAQLRRLRLDRDTLVLFTSDNGPWFEGSAGGLRARKNGSGYDGGARVPCIAWRPGTVRAGARSGAIAMGIDVLPTLCAMAGVPLPPGVTSDGRDLTAVLTRGAPSPHDELLLFSEADIAGIRAQHWKYVVADWYAGVQNSLEKRGYPQLYDLRTDPGESYSVASLHPGVLKAMEARLARARAIFTPLRPGKSRITPAAPVRIPGIIQD